MITISNTFIVAEIGVNHNGDIDTAKKLISAAKRAGADAVKTQSFYAEKVTSRFAKKAEYQLETTTGDDSQLEMLRKLQLSKADLIELSEYSKKLEISFFSTPFDLQSIEDLADLNFLTFKIPSGEITNLPYLIAIAKLNKATILSTGMSTLNEVRQAVNVLQDHGCDNLTLLHCNTQYPTPIEHANVRAMQTLRDVFNLPVGYSDHTQGTEAVMAAVALGARIIEKHFTLSCDMEGPDHKASMEPEPFRQMVRAIRRVEAALGDGSKAVTFSEQENLVIARKSIVASRDIRTGELYSEENITTKRPGNGVSPMLWFDVLGQAARRDYMEDELIEL